MPTTLQLIQAIEAAIGAGNGAQKAALAVTALTGAASLAGASDSQVAKVQTMAPNLINAGVATLNATGVFKKAA